MAAPVRRVALLSIDPWRNIDGKYRPFNYPVRKIEAAIRSSEALRDVEVRVFDRTDADAESLAAELEKFDPDVVGGSTYLWSFPTFLDVAEHVRARRADVTFIMGGPSARPEMFALAPFAPRSNAVDALVLGEGEEIIVDILRAEDRTREGLSKVPGLAIYGPNGWQKTADRPLPDLSNLASPYQMDLVPHGYTAHLETFRGCPLSCAFCQWGDLSKASRIFSREYLVRELQGFERMGARGVAIVDAALNLNPRAFRNLVAAEKEVAFLRKAHFNTEIYPSHMTDEHLAFLELIKADSVGIGLQSYDKEVLARVERPFQEERFERVVRDVASIVPETVVEIILGLPGDNIDSFRRTLERARQLPVGVRIYRCVVLPNALMSRAPAHFAMEYDPFTLEMYSCWGWPREDIERACREVADMVHAEGGDMDEGCNSWKLSSRQDVARRRDEAMEVVQSVDRSVEPSIRELLERVFEAASERRWVLREAQFVHEKLLAQVDTPDGALQIEVAPARADEPHYCRRSGLAFSYFAAGRATPSPEDLRALTTAAETLGPMLRRYGPLATRSPTRLPIVAAE